MIVVLMPEPGVAQAMPAAAAPNAHPAMIPTATSFFFINMVSLLWFAIEWTDIAPGAQTDRWGNAGPVRNLRDGLGLTGRFS